MQKKPYARVLCNGLRAGCHGGPLSGILVFMQLRGTCHHLSGLLYDAQKIGGIILSLRAYHLVIPAVFVVKNAAVPRALLLEKE